MAEAKDKSRIMNQCRLVNICGAYKSRRDDPFCSNGFKSVGNNIKTDCNPWDCKINIDNRLNSDENEIE